MNNAFSVKFKNAFTRRQYLLPAALLPKKIELQNDLYEKIRISLSAKNLKN